MSGSEDQGGAGRREVAYRVFAAEFDDADFSYSESDEERAPNYVVSPTGGRINRLFVVGVLTEVENASEDVLRARVVDPTGAFVVYAGQYQPDARAFFERAEPPLFVAVTGKARTFQPDDSDVTYTSIRPENVNEVDAETRDRWTVGTARQTLDRVRTMADALARDQRGDELRAALEAEGVDTGLAAGVPLAIDHYGTTAAYLDAVRNTAVQAAEVVAGEREEVEPHSASPDAPGEADLATLAALDVTASVGGETTDIGGAVETEPSGASGTASTDAGTDTTETEAATGTDTASADASGETASAGGEAAGGESATASAEADETGSPSTDSEPASAESEPVGAEGATGAEAEPSGSGSTESAAVEADPAPAGESAGSDDIGSDAGADAVDTGVDSDGDDLEDFDGEFELDEEEREEIEEEYGTSFQSGTEVDEPGEAGIETPDPEELAEAEAEAGAGESPSATAETGSEADEPASEAAETATGTAEEPATETTDEPATDTGPESEPEPDTADEVDSADAEEPAEDVDVEDAVMDAMAEHDDGEGAHADEIVEAVTARTGAAEEEVREAIQDALMGGRCYEPEDDVYKPI
ncbi:hypothetical protein [Halosimplex halophilum]|uniref:hypothetical protein n=1 Tax=Halosimplex halophilum TaxID=2559572 RepID=UPI00107F0EF3|nr:hypothetical protein [Halosimplex halophilum]